MLIIITNREHAGPLPQTVSRQPISFISNQLGDDPDRNYTVKIVNKTGVSGQSFTVADKELEFYPEDKLTTIFDGEDPNEIARQWVVYMHGHHQDPEENIQKSLLIEKIHKVNVLAFSWPSHPYMRSNDNETQISINVIEKAIKAALGIRGWQAYLFDFVWGKGEELRETWTNYPIARKNAVLSGKDFLASLQTFSNTLFPLTRSRQTPNLLVTSQGHQVLHEAVNQGSDLPMDFNSITLHQADVNAREHINWAPSLHHHCNHLNITVNVYDSTLFAAVARNHALQGGGDHERLGITRQHYLVDEKTRYIDLTEMPCAGLILGCEYEHEYYIKDSRELIGEVVDLMRACLYGAPDFFPINNGETKNNISKMPSEINIFKTEWIIMDVERGEGNGDQGRDEERRSIDLFEDPLALNDTVGGEDSLDE